jgi:hypothetical protein
MQQEDIEAFAILLEEAGYENALELIEKHLIPLARQNHFSLYLAAVQYANQDEEQDTSYFQLFQALLVIPKERLEKVNVHDSL